MESGKILDSGIAALRDEIQLHPDHVTAHRSLGNAPEANRGSTTSAIAECRTAIKLRARPLPKRTTASGPSSAIGSTITRLPRPRFGRPSGFQARLRRGPPQPRAPCKPRGKHDEAIAEFRTAIKLRPATSPEAQLYLGAILCDQVHDYPAAEAAFRQAIRLKPDYAQAHSDLASAALQAQGKHDEAITEFRTAIRQARPSPRPHNNLLGPYCCDWLHDARLPEAAFHGRPSGQARLRRGTRQPRQRPASSGEARRGHRRVPACSSSSSPTSLPPTPTSAYCAPRGSATRPSPNIAPPSRSSPTSLRPA